MLVHVCTTLFLKYPATLPHPVFALASIGILHILTSREKTEMTATRAVGRDPPLICNFSFLPRTQCGIAPPDRDCLISCPMGNNWGTHQSLGISIQKWDQDTSSGCWSCLRAIPSDMTMMMWTDDTDMKQARQHRNSIVVSRVMSTQRPALN